MYLIVGIDGGRRVLKRCVLDVLAGCGRVRPGVRAGIDLCGHRLVGAPHAVLWGTYTASRTIAAAATGTLFSTAIVVPPSGALDPDPENNFVTNTVALNLSTSRR